VASTLDMNTPAGLLERSFPFDAEVAAIGTSGPVLLGLVMFQKVMFRKVMSATAASVTAIFRISL